ncbi:hypothetical protein GMORB2_5546 [Geosmithia morbida]|uniref:linoleate 8R-lipoxygenase n=1 Tax=Geosmithia morbida TaxID=1094350 RepID=A0A9P5D5I7_9HYPO|nr:uncharacterized protein GMORB2_5546 [Geosmithia morbida]KAF4123830.1 hypothetical protein GMORB2_5546 [Geosmithia morbida]
MPSNEKFQAGESYADPEPTKGKPIDLSDPVGAAKALFTDYVAARGELTFPELLSILKDLMAKGPSDDRKGWETDSATDLLIKFLTALPADSTVRAQLTNKFIQKLWGDLQHPPLSFMGSDSQYEVVKAGDANTESDGNAAKHDVVEFDVPDNGTRLRERAHPSLNGSHHYRMPDGSGNNVLQPDLGKAGSAYAKSVRSEKRLHGVKPDPGLLFDLLMARDDDTFKENPAGISSVLFYHASIIIHDIFRTNRTNMNKTDTSSYLDLAPLYGSSLKDQIEVRTMKEGKLKPDTFHEKRLLGQPPGVNALLVLWNRYHNYVCEMLLKINENGRFTLSCRPDATTEQRGEALAKQDHDLFNTARLIVCGMYVSISLGDYLRAIMNLHPTTTEWSLDPRVEIGKNDGNEPVERGVGNQVSAEFNLLYRFHSCISRKDERWINDFFLELFPGRTAEDLENVSVPDLGAALVEFEKRTEVDPSKRTFGGLVREDGKFKDEDLVRILKESMEDPAGTFGARMVPKALKVVEVLGIKQARKWQVASLNEFRDFFHLKRYDSFLEINPDPEIAKILENLYADPDMVEMYPGIMIEQMKPSKAPGSGICPTYSVGRAVLSDAITLVRSDRFFTVDFTVSSLTAWGYKEIERDPKTLGGSMMYKLIHRALPDWFPFNSVSAMQPMYTKKANVEIAKKLGTIDQYSLDDPKPPARKVALFSADSIKHVMGNPKSFPLIWNRGLNLLYPGKKDLSWFMLCGDEPKNLDHRDKMLQAMGKIPNIRKTTADFVSRLGSELIQRESFQLKKGLIQMDVVRDVSIPLNAQILADLFYLDLRTDENPNGTFSHAELYRHLVNIRMWASNNNNSAEAWNRRRRAQESATKIIETTRKLVDEVSSSQGFGLGVKSRLSSITTRKRYLKEGSLRSCGYKLVEELLAKGNSPEYVTDQLWLTAFGGTGVLTTTFYQVTEFFLRPENASIWSEVQSLAEKDKDDELQKYVCEAQRLTAPLATVRIAAQATELEGESINAGDVVLLMLGEAARKSPDVTDGDKFDPWRKPPQVDTFNVGQHSCIGKGITLTFISGLVKLVAGLKELRPADGETGGVKCIEVDKAQIFLNDNWSYLAAYANNFKVHFSGHGKGTYTFKDASGNDVDLGRYYNDIKLRKGKQDA